VDESEDVGLDEGSVVKPYTDPEALLLEDVVKKGASVRLGSEDTIALAAEHGLSHSWAPSFPAYAVPPQRVRAATCWRTRRRCTTATSSCRRRGCVARQRRWPRRRRARAGCEGGGRRQRGLSLLSQF
jgi:hypothetical protein